MKAAPLLVSWHNENAAIYSAHFEPHGKGRLATGGGDNNVRVSFFPSNNFLPNSIFLLAWLQSLTEDEKAMETRRHRRRTEGDLPFHPYQAHASRQCRTVGSQR